MSHDSAFMCNVCMEPVKDRDPVLTTCGHLYCWPCLHHWLSLDGKETCPVCSAVVRVDKNVIPVYINATDDVDSNDESQDDGSKGDSIPSRPTAQRPSDDDLQNEEECEEVAEAKRLVSMLCNMSDPSAQQEALDELADEDFVWGCTEALFEAGVLLPLIGLLAGRSATFQRSAATAIGNIAQEDDFRVPIFQTGVVSMLVKVLQEQTGNDDTEAQAAAIAAIAAIADSERNLVPVLDTGVVPQLVSLMESSDAAVQLAAVEALKTLSKAPANRLPICESGAAEALVGLLSAADLDEDLLQAALVCITSLATDARNATTIMITGAVVPLVELLSSKGYITPALAAEAICALATESEACRVKFNEAGAAPALIELLVKGEDAEQVAAARAMELIASADANKLSLFHAGAIKPLAKLLSRGCRRAQQHAAAAIGQIAGCASSASDDDDISSSSETSGGSSEVWEVLRTDVLRPLIMQLKRDDEETQLRAIESIELIAQALPPHVTPVLVQADAFAPIVALLRPTTTTTAAGEAMDVADAGAEKEDSDQCSELHAAVSKTISAICKHDDVKMALIEAGAIPLLLDIMRVEVEVEVELEEELAELQCDTQRLAVLSLKAIADSDRTREQVKAAGAMAVLTALIDSTRSREVRSAADEAIDVLTATFSFGLEAAQMVAPMQLLLPLPDAAAVAAALDPSQHSYNDSNPHLQHHHHHQPRGETMTPGRRSSKRPSFASRSRSGSLNLSAVVSECLVEHRVRHSSFDHTSVLLKDSSAITMAAAAAAVAAFSTAKSPGSSRNSSRRPSFARSRSNSFTLGRVIGETLLEHPDRQ